MSETINTALRNKFWGYLKGSVPRILSQLDRDKDSPTFGSFDRNFWHFKIRDFSSMIIQQGMLVLWSLYRFEAKDNPYYNHPKVKEWIIGGMDFWAKSQLKGGSFNEYYPFEQGYPPTAFSLYTIGLILKDKEFQANDKVMKAVQKTVNWLLQHPEKEALNQEAAGLAGLVLVSDVEGIKVDAEKLEEQLSWFYSTQKEEGWFPEYGGPDIGYLSVTIDCLWDIYVTSHDKRAYNAVKSATEFISQWIGVSGETPVMINSRNTDYIVPYGMVCLGEENGLSSAAVHSLLSKLDDANHYLNRTDDRYACHYVYQSCFRSLVKMDNMQAPAYNELAVEQNKDLYFKEAGIFIRHRKDTYSLSISLQKGGIFSLYNTDGIKAVDFGWRYKTDKGKIAVSHWLDENYRLEHAENELKVEGDMSIHSFMEPSPLKHIVLRVMSYIAGRKIIPLLKKMMIFGNPKADVSFKRIIKLDDDQMTIDDSFTGNEKYIKALYKAPHYSLRHVASAGLFVPEELLETGDHNKSRSIQLGEGK